MEGIKSKKKSKGKHTFCEKLTQKRKRKDTEERKCGVFGCTH